MSRSKSSRVAVLGLALVGVLAPRGAAAHESASYSRSILVERYLVCDDDLDARCVGPEVAHDRLLHALELGAIDPERNNDRIVDPARDAAVMVAYFDMKDAIPALRRMLVTPMPEGAKDTHAWLEVHALRAEAAYALAQLGDLQSADEIVKQVRDFETHGHGSLWADTLAALTELSPTHASAYAREFLARIELADLRMSMPGGSSQLEALAPIIATQDRAALPVLRRLTAGEDAGSKGAPKIPLSASHGWCQLMAARLAIGEQPLVDEVREQFAGSYSGTMVATCDNAFMHAFGRDAKDADILLRHLGRDDHGFDAGMSLVAYDRMIALIAALNQRSGAAVERAKKKLLQGLRERSRYPHVADPTHGNFGTHFVALHRAALAGLGDAESREILRTMILDAQDRSGVGDLAALRAVQLDVPGAVDDAAARLALDVAFRNDERSGIFRDVRVRLFDALRERAPDDPRWAIAVIDGEQDVRERAMHAISRHTPKGSCAAVTSAANDATPRGIDDGFLVLTTLPGGCRSELERVAEDARAPAKTRGMAFEALAVLGSKLPQQLAKGVRDDDMRVYVERADLIARTVARH